MKVLLSIFVVIMLTACNEDEINSLKTQIKAKDDRLTSLADELQSSKDIIQEQRVELKKVKDELQVFITREKEKSKFGVLKLQAGVTMKNGITKPLTNTKVYVTKESFPQIANNLDFSEIKLGNYGCGWCLLRKMPDYFADGADYLKLTNSLNEATLLTLTTTFQGTAEENLKPGKYFLSAVSELGGGVSWSVPVTIKGGQKTQITFDNENLMDHRLFN